MGISIIPEYHPYVLPYKTTPQLHKYGTDFGNGEYDKMIFQTDGNYKNYIVEKFQIKHQPVHIDRTYIKEIREITSQLERLGADVLPTQDDYTIHKLEEGVDKLIYTHVYFPSLWNPAESLGKSLLTFHEPVPKLTLPPKVLESCTKNRYVRFVWSIFHNQRLNQHPDLPLETFNVKNPNWHVRIERQSIIGFPEIGCFLFVIKPYIVKNPKLKELHTTICGMSQEFKDYKRITPEFEEYLK